MRLALLAFCFALGGCSTYQGARYTIAADNVVALRAYRGQAIGVGAFTSSEPGKNEIMCRGVGPVRTPDGEPFADYIRKALVDELKMAEIYADGAPVTLTGTLDAMDFNSTGVGARTTSSAVLGTNDPEPIPPHWALTLTVASSNGRKFTVSERYDFAGNFAGEVACNQTAHAMMPAVQNLVGRLVRSPEFPALLKR